MSTTTETVAQVPIQLRPIGSEASLAPASDPTSTPTLEDDQASQLQRMGTEEETEDDGLPPQDRGRKAWTFVAAACVLETFVWGFVTSYSPVLVWFQSHDPWRQYSLAALSAIPTIQLSLQYFLP
ncbi:hypothetical protein JCM5350_007631, partial [Sporobolomyces pararoseus]